MQLPRRRREPEDETSSGRSPTSSAPAEGPNPLGFEGAPPFVPDDDRPPVAHAADLEAGDEYVPPAAEPVEWTPERAGDVCRGLGALLHYADPLGREPGGDDLWRLTETDALEIGAPLARILNRYGVVRQLAGYSDEATLGIVLMGYGRRNLAHRGELVAARQMREGAPPPGPFEGAEFADHETTADVPIQGLHGPAFPPTPEEPVE